MTTDNPTELPVHALRLALRASSLLSHEKVSRSDVSGGLAGWLTTNTTFVGLRKRKLTGLPQLTRFGVFSCFLLVFSVCYRYCSTGKKQPTVPNAVYLPVKNFDGR